MTPTRLFLDHAAGSPTLPVVVDLMADLYRAGWDDDRRGGWDDDDRRRGQKNGRGWGPGGRPANDWRYRQDGWNRQGWHAEQFYRPGNNYQPRYLGANDQIWPGYDSR